jgi:hypothetical protein
VFIDLKQAAEADSQKTNKLGTFVSWVCQREEEAVLTSVQESFVDQGFTVGVLVFDGLMLERREDGRQPDLSETQAHIFKGMEGATGRKIPHTHQGGFGMAERRTETPELLS